MRDDNDQLLQRRANLAALAALGVDLYPRHFARTHTVNDLVGSHGSATGDDLNRSRVETATAGRILAIRSFGKANFLAISDGRARIQVYVRQDAVSERDFSVFKLLDLGDFVGVAGHLFRTRTNELTIWAVGPDVSRQVPPPAPGEVARPPGRRDPVPPAVPRPDRQPRVARASSRREAGCWRRSATSSIGAASSRWRRR